MSLKLIQGPPNSGRAELVRRGFRDALERGPVLVVPRVDDVFRFERELCASGAVLGGAAMTFSDLFRQVVTAAGTPPHPELGRAQRLQAISAAVAERRASLRALRDSAGRAGFARALDQLLGELQGAGLGPNSVEAAAETLEGSAFLGDISSLYSGYAEACERLGRTDSHGIARQAIALLRKSAELWAARPVFLEGFDDLTPNQLDLVEALAERTEVTVALPFDPAHPAFAERTRLLDALRKRIGIDEEVRTEADPQSAENPFLFELEQDFGSDRAAPRPLGEGLTLLRSAGERGEAEAIAAVVGRLLHEGATEDEIAIVLRDPERRGGLLARVLESCGIAIALEAELPVSSTGVGGALIALLEAEHGTRRAVDVLRWLRGPAAVSAGRVDWLERRIRRRRLQSADEALAAWLDLYEELPRDLRRLREAGPEGLVGEAGAIARRMAARFVAGGEDGPPPGPGDGGELRAAATISAALAELAELPQIAPGPEELIGFLRGLSFRVWSGPIEGRVRIADPRRLRGSRFNHVIVGSLQDGEFPRLGGGDPFLSERQRLVLGLDPRREVEAEERYLFHACLALPRRSLYLSCRDSDANGAAEARSPLIDEVRRLLNPPPGPAGGDSIEESIALGRDLAQVVHRVGEAPSPDELTRAVAIHSTSGRKTALDLAAPDGETRARVEARLAAAARAEEASREPGPLMNPAVIEALRAVPAYGGTTLEGFDLCSYRWFVEHELRPQALDPAPDAMVQGGLMHEILNRLYRESPGDTPVPRPESLAAWIARGRELLAEAAAEGNLGERPAERAIRRRVERLLVRFLSEEAERAGAVFEPWLLESRFGDDPEAEKPALEIDGWRLHGAIDRADRSADGRALIHDYKMAGSASPAKKLEEDAKLQLQLYMLAVRERWGLSPIGALYHPLRATRERNPRGLVLKEEAADLAGYGLVRTDLLSAEDFEKHLEEARERAGWIVARMRDGKIDRDPGPRPGLRNHDVCPSFCDFAPICRRERPPATEEEQEPESNGG